MMPPANVPLADFSATIQMVSAHTSQIASTLLYASANHPRHYKKLRGGGDPDSDEDSDDDDGGGRRHRDSNASAPDNDEIEDYNLDWYGRGGGGERKRAKRAQGKEVVGGGAEGGEEKGVGARNAGGWGERN
jgi:hypothetical protein